MAATGAIASRCTQLRPAAECAWLGREWMRLEAQADPSPFMAWPWVSTWLATLPATVRPWLFSACDGSGTPFALALLVDAPERGIGRCFGRRTWHVQETGDADLDEVTIEYGGLLAPPQRLGEAYAALAAELARLPSDWRRLCIPSTAQAAAIASGLPAGLEVTSTLARPSHHVELDRVRAAAGGYASVLGKATRGSLRRALRAYEALGPLRAEVAADPATAHAWFDGMEVLHTRYWRSRGEGGCFSRPYFGRFHRALIDAATPSGLVAMTRVTAGGTVVGYTYNLCWRGVVYYYNAGFDYGLIDRNDRPGFVCLHAVVEQAAAAGHAAFDFLAGDQDYKRRLATGCRTLHSIEIRRKGVRATAERVASSLARRGRPGLPLSLALAAQGATGA